MKQVDDEYPLLKADLSTDEKRIKFSERTSQSFVSRLRSTSLTRGRSASVSYTNRLTQNFEYRQQIIPAQKSFKEIFKTVMITLIQNQLVKGLFIHRCKLIDKKYFLDKPIWDNKLIKEVIYLIEKEIPELVTSNFNYVRNTLIRKLTNDSNNIYGINKYIPKLEDFIKEYCDANPSRIKVDNDYKLSFIQALTNHEKLQSIISDLCDLIHIHPPTIVNLKRIIYAPTNVLSNLVLNAEYMRCFQKIDKCIRNQLNLDNNTTESFISTTVLKVINDESQNVKKDEFSIVLTTLIVTGKGKYILALDEKEINELYLNPVLLPRLKKVDNFDKLTVKNIKDILNEPELIKPLLEHQLNFLQFAYDYAVSAFSNEALLKPSRDGSAPCDIQIKCEINRIKRAQELICTKKEQLSPTGNSKYVKKITEVDKKYSKSLSELEDIKKENNRCL
jgi:hypothetical protein